VFPAYLRRAPFSFRPDPPMPSLPRALHAVIFDMDGLLIDTEKPVRQATLAAARAVGRPMDDGFYAGIVGTPWPETWAMLSAHLGDADRYNRFRRVFDSHIQPLLAEVRLMAGVVELLDHLDAAGMPMAVCTSTGRDKAHHHLQRVGILHRFRQVVTCDDVSRGKPDPEPYRLAAGRLGVDPAHCLALEDSYNGIRAAHAAGMMAVMIPDILPPTAEMGELALHILDDLHAVRTLLGLRG